MEETRDGKVERKFLTRIRILESGYLVLSSIWFDIFVFVNNLVFGSRFHGPGI